MAKARSSNMSRELIEKIKALLATGKYYQHQIAALVGVNQGRVSEVKNGHYG